jgi:hypothetical protein
MKKLSSAFVSCFISLISYSQIPTTGMVAYWPFDGNANDLSGNNNHGTVNNAIPATDRFGNSGRCYSFNGIDSHIDVANSSTVDMPNNQDFSISFWIKTNGANNNGIPLCKTIYGSWNGYIFFAENVNSGYCNTAGQLSFYVAAGAMGDACANSGICSDNANWYYITGIHKSSSNQTYLYVNGVLQTDVGTKSGVTNNLKKLYFGACSTGSSFVQFFNGYLDGVRMYNRILDQAEIIELYNEADPAVGIEELNPTLSNLSLLPNPVSGNDIELIFNSKIKKPCTIKIIDNVGRTVLESSEEILPGHNKIKLSLQNISSGIYYLIISNGSYSENLKFVKE